MERIILGARKRKGERRKAKIGAEKIGEEEGRSERRENCSKIIDRNGAEREKRNIFKHMIECIILGEGDESGRRGEEGRSERREKISIQRLERGEEQREKRNILKHTYNMNI